MPAIIPAIARELAEGVDDVLEQAAAVGTGNQGSYIKDGNPGSVYGKIQQGAARQACRRYADDPSKFSGAAKVLVENACRPYLEDIGYGTPPTISTPVDGGQCAALYRFEGTLFWTVTGSFVGSPSDVSEFAATENILQGPVSFIGARFFDPGPFGPRGFVCQFQTGSGLVETITKTNATFGQSKVRLSGSFLDGGGSVGVCGSPPAEITDPVPPPSPGPKYEPFNPGPDVDVNIGVDINPDGTISIDVGTGPITIDPFGTGGDSGGGSGGDPGDPTDPGSPGESISTGVGGTAEDEAGGGEELVGVLVEVLSAPQGANLFANNSAQVYRGIGYVRMGFPGRLGTDVSGGAVISPQFFHAQQRGLTNYAVRANVGFNLRATPYYRSIPE